MIAAVEFHGASACTFRTPGLRSAGPAATLVAEVTRSRGSPTVAVSVEQRDRDGDSWSFVGSLPPLCGCGTAWAERHVGEEFRFVLEYSGARESDRLRCVIHAPKWRASA